VLRELVIAFGVTAGIVSCSRGGESTRPTGTADGQTALPPDAPAGTTAIGFDPETGQMVTRHLDSSGKWHIVDTEAVIREVWNIPPEMKSEDFDAFKAKQPEQPSPEEMNKIMEKHYLD